MVRTEAERRPASARQARSPPGDLRIINGVMDGDGLKLRIDLGVEPDADAAELDEATQQLRRELLELDVENVERPSAGPAPPGAPSALARSCYWTPHEPTPLDEGDEGECPWAPERWWSLP